MNTPNRLQVLSFTLGAEVFAVDVGQVQEVLEMVPIAKIPETPNFMRGVINLRGRVVPVVDLRLKFGMPPVEDTVNTCIIVVEASVDGEPTVLGAVADSVREVLELAPQQIEVAPRMGTQLRPGLLRGIGKCEGGFIMLLDADRVFSFGELSAVATVVEERVAEDAG